MSVAARIAPLLLTLAVVSCANQERYPSSQTMSYPVNSAGSATMYGSVYGSAPPPDPARKVSVQDCTKPIVQDGCNLLCK